MVSAEVVLPKVLRVFGPVPAVTAASEVSGPWDQPGSTRRVHLADGTAAREQVTVFRRPEWFGYRVWDLGGPFGRLVHEATGEWVFAEVEGATIVHWTYRFYPRRASGRPPPACLT